MQCTCRMAGRCARCRVAGWGQQWSAHCDLGHASTSRRVQPAQPSIGQQEVSICRIMYIIMLLLLSTGRNQEAVCWSWCVQGTLCCLWSEFSDILHDGVQAPWYYGTCAQSAQDTHATHRRASHSPNKGQGRQTH